MTTNPSRSRERAPQPWAEPVAIIGLGCRFPGGADPAAFWNLLREGVDAISEIPPERWDLERFYDPDMGSPGKMNTRWGGFVHGADRFDALFFGISPGEATSMDPQQRLLLEVAWETFESAGLPPERLRGSQTGVYIGISGNEYATVCFREPEDLNAYFVAGNSLCMTINRLSFAFGLLGPSMALDTGCSSSLVAVHLACQSLLSGECEMALAGGVSLIFSPMGHVGLSQSWITAADGRCKSFDADADGYVRGEGCGLVALKRLSDAQRDGDHILALVRGSAVNQSGQGKALIAPNQQAQEAVLRQALGRAGLAPGQIDYLEAHGVGTLAADLAEGRALTAVFGPRRTDAPPCALGSVKTNIGHLEPAAGIAALIKVLLGLRHDAIPAHLHLRRLHPELAEAGFPFVIPSATLPWPAGERVRRAGINSFGLGGTNAHVVLEEAPPAPPRPSAPERPAHLLALSARSAPALRELAGRYADLLAAQPDTPLADLCFSAATGRAHFAHRLALPASSPHALRELLARFAAGATPAGLAVGQATREPQVTLLLDGAGPFDPALAGALAQTEPVVRAALERCGQALDGAAPPGDVPALGAFALLVALVELWRAWGLAAEPLGGSGLGQDVAAWATGQLDLPAALARALARGALPEAPGSATAELRADAGGGLTLVLRPAGDPALLWPHLLDALAGLYAAGARLDWSAFDAPYPRRRLILPSYPFQRRRFWAERVAPEPEPAAAPSAWLHPLVERRVRSPLPIFETRLSAEQPAGLACRLFGAPTAAPGAGLALAAAAAHLWAAGPVALEQVTLGAPPALDRPRETQLIITPSGPDAGAFQLFALEAGEQWQPFAAGQLRAGPPAWGVVPALDTLRAACPTPVDPPTFYRLLASVGLECPEALQPFGALWRGEQAALGWLDMPAAAAGELAPALIEAAWHLLTVAATARLAEAATPALPTALARLLADPPALTGRLWAYAQLQPGDAPAPRGDVWLLDQHGAPVLLAEGLLLAPCPDQWRQAGGAAQPERPGTPGDPLRHLDELPPEQCYQALSDALAAELLQVLRQAPGQIDPDQHFFEAGLDSLAAIELKNRLQSRLGRSLPATLVFEHPRLAELARALAELLGLALPLEDLLAQHADSDDLAAFLADLDQLSDEEAEALLNRADDPSPQGGLQA